jgi:predicted dehydrogenase
MTIVGSKRMVVYDDVAQQEKIKIFDARVERPPHYDTFGEFHYAYHYGDINIPYIQQEEPLKAECQHFLECIRQGATPLTSGRWGLEVVRILEASSESLRREGAAVDLSPGRNGKHAAPATDVVQPLGRSNGNGHADDLRDTPANSAINVAGL